jgi:epoxide hydrolase-like predicted phosphatase
MIDTILIDYGNTIMQVDQKKRKYLFKKFDVSEEEYKKIYEIYRMYSLGKIKSDDEYHRLCSLLLGRKEQFSKAFLDAIQSTEVINKNTLKLLRKLRKKYKLIIVANNVKEWIVKKLKEYGIYKLFDGVVVSSELGIRKPDPRIFTYTLKKFKLKPEKCIFISDELNEDLTGAKVLGIKTVWFRNLRYKKFEEKTFTPDFIIKKLDDIERVVNSLNRCKG